MEVEQHARIGRHRLAVHQAVLLRLLVASDLNLEFDRPVIGIDSDGCDGQWRGRRRRARAAREDDQCGNNNQ